MYAASIEHHLVSSYVPCVSLTAARSNGRESEAILALLKSKKR